MSAKTKTWADYMFTLPLPPSANNLVMPVGFVARGKSRGRLIPTAEAKSYRKTAHDLMAVVADSLLEGGFDTAPLLGPLEMHATFSVATTASDGANRLKALEDALIGIVFKDDKQICEWHLRKAITAGFSGVMVCVKPAGDPDDEFARRLAKSTINSAKPRRLTHDKPKRTTKAGLKSLATPAEYHP